MHLFNENLKLLQEPHHWFSVKKKTKTFKKNWHNRTKRLKMRLIPAQPLKPVHKRPKFRHKLLKKPRVNMLRKKVVEVKKLAAKAMCQPLGKKQEPPLWPLRKMH